MKFEQKVLNVLNKIEHSEYEYDLVKAPDRIGVLQDRFTRTMLINSVWYGGNDLELKMLYERELPRFKVSALTSDELNYFWAQTTEGTNIRKLHSGLPQLISEKMVDLLISNGYEYGVYLDDEYTDRDEDNEARLLKILDENNWHTTKQEGIETESWAGGFAIKLSLNEKYEFPIIELIQPEAYEPKIEAGRIVEDTFIKYFSSKKTNYKLKEHYGIDKVGGYIRYSLYKYVNNEWLSCELSETKETKDLKDIQFVGVFEKFSLYKPNKLPNSEFRGSKLGESDYSGSHGIFDAIDETLSTMVQEFRDAKIKNMWPSNMLYTDPITQKQYMPKALEKDFIVYKGGISEDAQKEHFTQMQGDLNSEKYLESYKKLLETAINNAGLSPQSMGVTGLESTSASEESQELREKTSIRTREKKVALWKPFLNKLFELVLKLDDIRTGSKVGDYIIRSQFNDYKIQTIDDKTRIASQGITSKTWDIKSAVQYIHDEMTEEEQILTVVRIKIENGINVFTKEEESVYRKFVQEVEVEKTPPVVELEETETDVLEDIEDNNDGTIS